MGGVVAVVAAQRARLVREIVGHLREQKALSPEAAALVRPQRLMGRQALRSMVQDGSVVGAGDDRYWLDETGYAAARKIRMSTTIWFIAAALIVVAAIVWLAPKLTHGG